MKHILVIYTISLILFSCNNKHQERIDYFNSKLETRPDSDWIVKKYENQREWKYLENINDSNLACRSIADTICYLIVFNINEQKKDSLKNIINSKLDMPYDSIYHPKSIKYFEHYELKWFDKRNLDIIRLTKTKMTEKAGFGNWTLEISNDSLLNRLNKNHDPFYNLPIPGRN